MGNDHRFTRGTLALTGLAMNAMVLIAPGTFLWVTFKMQSLYGVSMAGSGMLFGILYAIFICIAAITSY
jgi:APA family basic amino acid/polyamine antiporter